MVTVLSIVLWTSLAVVFYSYVGYPLLIFATSRIARRWASNEARPVSCAAESTEAEVTVAVNRCLQCRAANTPAIQNLLACDYPPECLQILIASDGSTDGTVQLAREFDRANVAVIPFPQRSGKARTLVAAVEFVTSQVIVFTDAATEFESMAIRRLAEHFVDPAIGIVAGKVAILDEHGLIVRIALLEERNDG